MRNGLGKSSGLRFAKGRWYSPSAFDERALKALQEARRISKLKNMASASSFAKSPFVFPPSKGGLWIEEPSVTIKHFHAALDALSIRRRRQYDARHTYATMCLLAGMNPAFIAS
ncbi:hypothetical protein [Stutzerimonas nitrititolerans]|uniref:hypothetical protein n=1 Tax=Stutzerimonas nitrititolerans TaxID=2482751 RepID=UPI0028ACA9A4|nr:hypothetical protein [Stutzerimonas nitrititolerans]